MVQAVSLVPLASTTFARLSYAEATERFGTDRPDLRYGMELKDINDIVGNSAFRVFAENVAAGKPVKLSVPPVARRTAANNLMMNWRGWRASRREALAWLAIQPGSGEKCGARCKGFFTVDQLIAITERLDAQPGDRSSSPATARLSSTTC